MNTSRFSTTIPSLTKQAVTNYLALESSKWCPPNDKINWMNSWIKNGGWIPDKTEYQNPKIVDIATLVRKKNKESWDEINQQSAGINETTKTALSIIEKEGATSSHHLVDLGGGDSNLALFLLHKKWKVTVVDPSAFALHNLYKRTHQLGLHAIAEKNLTLVCQDMENYKFPSNVSLIKAQAAFPYCNPSKFENVWDNMYTSLAKGGRIAGNLFCHPKEGDMPGEVFFRLKFSPWFATEPLVKALLQNKGYKIETFTSDNHPQYSAIYFIGRKPS